MLLIIVITIVVLVLLSLGIALIILKIKDLSNENTHFTTLSPEQGKLIVKEGKIVDVLSNMEGVYYDEKGEKIEKENPKKYGSLFKEFGVVFFGISPINKIYTFSVSWSEYVEKEAKKIKENDNDFATTPSYEIVNKTVTIDSFKRFYSHAIVVKKVELKDGSKIDIVCIITFEILNIIQVIFKVKPDGIILAQAEAGFAGAIMDELRNYDYETFRDKTDKSDPDSSFVKNVLQKTNSIVEKKLHLRAYLMETKFFDQSKGDPGDEEFERVQTLKKINELKGDAEIALAEKMKIANKKKGEGLKDYFKEISEVVGKDNIAEYANLEQVKDTSLLSYGSPGNIIPMVNVQQPQSKEGRKK